MRVVHVVPTAFGSAGLLGGGERYPLELARALATDVDCELVTFGSTPGRWQAPGGLRVTVLRPLTRLGCHPAQPIALRLPAVLAGADIGHTHHFRCVPSRVAALTARLTGTGTGITDHGLTGWAWGGLANRLFDRFLTSRSTPGHLQRGRP